MARLSRHKIVGVVPAAHSTQMISTLNSLHPTHYITIQHNLSPSPIIIEESKTTAMIVILWPGHNRKLSTDIAEILDKTNMLALLQNSSNENSFRGASSITSLQKSSCSRRRSLAWSISENKFSGLIARTSRSIHNLLLACLVLSSKHS